VKAQLRCAASAESLDRSPWMGPGGAAGAWFTGSWAEPAGGLGGTWMQYRLALGAVNGCGTPRVSEVSVDYELA
jgi:hypothetical protein